MRCKCKLFSVNGIPAADGSVISRDVIEDWLSSESYKEGIEKRNLLGTITHAARSLSNLPSSVSTPTMNKTIGKNDTMLLVNSGCSAPTHYIERIYVENDGWCYADIKLFEEDGLDDIAIQYLRRLKGLLKQGVKIGCSMVCIGYWDDTPSGSSILRKCISISGVDFTLNPSWRSAGVTEIYNDFDERIFSELDPKVSVEFEGVKVKAFSLKDIELPEGILKSSKVSGKFCKLGAKQFSSWSIGENIPDDEIKSTEQKEFSVASIKERVRYAKFSPRQRFRRLVMEYKAVVKSMGGPEKIDEETMKVMKSLFATDVLDIMKSITPDIMAGKPIGTLIGASSLGKNIRVTTQKMQMPMKMALQQAQKQSYVTKNIYEKIQALYIQFIGELTEEVFSSKSTIPDLKPGEEEVEENTNE